jgi:hypothetical protein
VALSYANYAGTEPTGSTIFALGAPWKLVLIPFMLAWDIPGFSESDPSFVATDDEGGQHIPTILHRGQHDWQPGPGGMGAGENPFDCMQQQCFMRFLLQPNTRLDMGQPSLYAWVQQDLRLTESGGIAGKDTFNAASLTRSGPGYAMSKALVYYHRFRAGIYGRPPDPDPNGSGWREQPNFFNPYWRAKLHPFRCDDDYNEAAGLSTAALGGDGVDAAAIATGARLNCIRQ